LVYIGTQGILQGTYETFAAGDEAFRRRSFRKTRGLGRMGGMVGAQPLARNAQRRRVSRIDVDPERIKRRVKVRYCDVMVNDLDESLPILKNAVRNREPASVGLVGNCADLFPRSAKRGVVPDCLPTRLAHDPLMEYIRRVSTSPPQQNCASAILRIPPPRTDRLPLTCAACSTCRSSRGNVRLRNNIRTFAFEHGVKDAYDSPALCPPTFSAILRGRGPFRW